MNKIGLVTIFFAIILFLSGCTTEYNVTFISEDHDEIQLSLGEGKKLEVPELRKDDFIIEGWYLSYNSGETFDEKWDFDNDIIEADITLYASWKQEYFYISVLDIYDQIIYEERVRVGETIVDSNIDVSSIYIEGHTFIGFEESLPNVMGNSNLILHAVYEKNSYLLKYYNANEEILFIDEIPYNTDMTNYPMPVAPNYNGNTFVKWDNSIPLYMPSNDIEMKAKYEFYHTEYTFDISSGDYEEVLILDNYIVISDWRYNDMQGRVIVFDLEYDTIRYIEPSDGHANMKFGLTIDIEADNILVGAITADEFVGAMYLYSFSSESFERKISSEEDYRHFGSTIHIEGDYVITGSSFDAYFYQYHIFKISDESYERLVRPYNGTSYPQNAVIDVHGNNFIIGGMNNCVIHYKFNDESFEMEIRPSDGGYASYGHELAINDYFIAILSINNPDFTGKLYIYNLLDSYSEIIVSSDPLSNIYQEALRATDSYIFVRYGIPMENDLEFLVISEEGASLIEIGSNLVYNYSGLETNKMVLLLNQAYDPNITDSELLIYSVETEEYWTILIEDDSGVTLLVDDDYVYVVQISNNGQVNIDKYIH